MSTKRAVLIAKDCRLLSNQHNYGTSLGAQDHHQYSSINLNQNYKADIEKIVVHSESNHFLSNNRKDYASQNTIEFANHDNFQRSKSILNSWERNAPLKSNLNYQNYLQKDKKQTCKSNDDLNKSTLSLHIEAYENNAIKNKDINDGKIGEIKKSKLDVFGFCRQQKDEELMEAEVMAFKFSTKMMNPHKIEKYHDIENVPQPRITSHLSQLRKGTGGRASFSGNVVTVFGSTGFLGLPVVNRLAKNGSQLILPYRCDPYYIRENKIVGELGQILFFLFELKDDDSIRKALKYSNVVVNLIGTNMPTGNYSFDETHVKGAERIARIAKEMGVERFIHVSALNATPDPKGVMIKGGSEFLRSKGKGEEAVRAEFPNATIIRPSVMYGMNDQFIFIYCSRYRKTPLDLVWLYKAGEQTYKMPVHVNDVALGIAKAVYDPTTDGKTYELVGPHCYKLGELIDFMYKRARCTPQFNYHFRRHGLFDPYFRTLAWGTQLWGKVFKCKVPLNWEWIEYVECTNDILSPNLPGFADLGVNRLAEFEYVGGQWADKCTFYGYFDEELGDCPTVPLPLRSPPIIKGRPDPRIADSKRSGFGFDVLN